MPQRHLIRRHIVEVTVPDPATGRRITPVVSDLIHNRVTQLLERLFDAAAGPDETRRIDRLELDLGHLDLGSLAEQLPARIEAALPAALGRASATVDAAGVPGMRPFTARHGDAQVRPDAAADPLLLISQFARTGGVPWWSDMRRQRLVDEAVETASRASPAALARTFRGVAGDDAALERLITHLSDGSLARVFAALAPATVDSPGRLAALLDTTPALGGLTPARRRLIAWRALLRAALGDAGPMMIEAALTAIAASLGMTLALLLDDLRAAIREASGQERSGQEHIGQEISALAERHPPPAGVRADQEPERLLGRLAQHRELAALLAHLARMVARLPDEGQAAWAAALTGIAPMMPHGLTPASLAALLRPFTRAGLITLSDLRDLLAPLALAEAAAAIPADAPPSAGEDEDSRIVPTAGLCLLWPFLPRFFARLRLLDDGETGFAGPPERHRAVLLLHHVATGEIEAPDFALMLPKVLCGLPPHAPHHALEPVTDAEAGEARQLLEAVIAHAACLGKISPDGFRGTFLNRDGILTTRDGAWLLRVERQTADVLLDRFPWTTEWVRQPWMQAAMRVEW